MKELPHFDHVYHEERAYLYLQQRDEARATVNELLVAMEKFVNHELHLMTEGDSRLETDALCPVCFLAVEGSFHSADPDDHHDNCPWPGLLAVLRKAHEEAP